MSSYLGAIWKCRYFWLSLVKMDLRTRYRRSVLGLGWSLLNPIAMTSVLCLVFAQIFHQSISVYGLYVVSGLACWNYIRTVTLQGCQSLFQGELYIRQYPAPMAIYPLRTALGETVHFLLALLVVIVLSWIFNGTGNALALLSLLPTLVLLFLFGWSLAVLAGFANVLFQDTQHLCEIGFQILFYATPIMWMPTMLGQGRLAQFLSFNPLIAFLNLIRDPILKGTPPTLASFSLASAICLLAVTAASLVLARLQRRLIFHL